MDEIIRTPVPAALAEKLISSSTYRDDFLMYYQHFENDGNKQLYEKWINEHLTSSKNEVLEHIFTLSLYIDFYSKAIIDKMELVLVGRFRELTKIAALDYLLSIHKQIPQSTFIYLNELAYNRTQNIIVKLQAFFNLLIYNPTDNINKIVNILHKTDHPTLLYRIVNQIDMLPANIKEDISKNIIHEVNKSVYDQTIKNELLFELQK